MSIQAVNAWVFLNEDEPKTQAYPNGVPYTDPSSCWQRLIAQKVYQAVDTLLMAFVEVVPTSTPGVIFTVPGYTLRNGVVTHSDGETNADYMKRVVADASRTHPGIRFMATLGYGNPEQISQIFTGCTTPAERQAAAAAFGQNVVAFCDAYGLNGLDVDWEGEIADGTSQEEFDAFCVGLRTAFGTKYRFTLTPATTALLTGTVVNATVDYLTLQLYAGWVTREEYQALGIAFDKLQYGATFEDSPGRMQTPQQVYSQATQGDYTIITQWRLNSENFVYEQDSQVTLYGMCKGAGANEV